MHKKNQASSDILSDHRRVGKTFVPPIRQLDKLTFIRWAEDILPEIVWIALLQNSYDMKDANEKALALAKACEQAVEQPNVKNRLQFAFISSYSHLTPDQINQVKKILGKTQLADIVESIGPLILLYPECPLIFLREKERSTDEITDAHIQKMKQIVGSILDRRGRPAMLTQATAMYIELITQHLKVFRGSGLEELEAIVDYPDSEASRRVASHIRASLTGLVMIDGKKKSSWCEYFWNRGYEISDCIA